MFIGEQRVENFENSEMSKPTSLGVGLPMTNFVGGHSSFSAAFVPVAQRGVIHAPSSPFASHREPRSAHLTSSHFVSDHVGHRPRDMGHYPRMHSLADIEHLTHGGIDPKISQRRGRVSLENVTFRDYKRPSERPRDREYHKRFSIGVPLHHPSNSSPVPSGGHTRPREDACSPRARHVTTVEVGFPVNPQIGSRHSGYSGTNIQSRIDRGAGAYYVRLVFAGDTVQHLVWPSMPISQLIEDAGNIFELMPAGISLILFSVVPVTLRRESTISAPPLGWTGFNNHDV
jgi:hypothetical protein